MKYHMPAEWEPHEGTWLAWPHNKSHWPGNFSSIPGVYCQMIQVLQKHEKVFLCVNDEAMERLATETLAKNGVSLSNVFFYRIPTDSSWTRDFGPIFVRNENGKFTILDWIFNCWGEKYPPWGKDDVVPQQVAKFLHLPLTETHMVFEGGSIDVNGKGTLLTTEQCLLNKNRNPKMSRAEIEKKLSEYLGATNILWLKEGIIGDDTDGHIDDIARFVSEDTLVACVEENKKDENYEILRKNFEDLEHITDQNGKKFTVIPIPMPDPVIYKGQRLPASYANFYIANGIVLLPMFRCQQDEKVIRLFEKLFLTRKIVPIDCVELVWGLGTFHCSTQQQPA